MATVSSEGNHRVHLDCRGLTVTQTSSCCSYCWGEKKQSPIILAVIMSVCQWSVTGGNRTWQWVIFKFGLMLCMHYAILIFKKIIYRYGEMILNNFKISIIRCHVFLTKALPPFIYVWKILEERTRRGTVEMISSHLHFFVLLYRNITICMMLMSIEWTSSEKGSGKRDDTEWREGRVFRWPAWVILPSL